MDRSRSGQDQAAEGCAQTECDEAPIPAEGSSNTHAAPSQSRATGSLTLAKARKPSASTVETSLGRPAKRGGMAGGLGEASDRDEWLEVAAATSEGEQDAHPGRL